MMKIGQGVIAQSWERAIFIDWGEIGDKTGVADVDGFVKIFNTPRPRGAATPLERGFFYL